MNKTNRTYGDFLQELKKIPRPPASAFLANEIKKLDKEEFELKLLDQIKKIGIPAPERQYKFHPDRQFKADICWPEIKFIVEVDGGVWLEKGGHTTGKGYESDRIRDAEALVLKYKVLRVTPGTIENGTAINYIEKLFYGYKDE